MTKTNSTGIMRKALIIIALLISTVCIHAQKEKWYQAGFRVSTQFMLNKEYTPTAHVSSMRTVHFGGYFRAGKSVWVTNISSTTSAFMTKTETNWRIW